MDLAKTTQSPFKYLILTLTACLILPVFVAWKIHLRQRSKSSPPRGCRRLGIQTESNLTDEHSPQYSSASKAHGGPKDEIVGTVKALFIYPIKSCARLELSYGEIVKTGLAYDRQFAFAEWNVDKQGKGNWKFITQRTHPILTQVESEIWVPDEHSRTYSAKEPNVRSNGILLIRFPCARAATWRSMLSLFALVRRRLPEHGTVRLPYSPTPEQIQENGYTLEELTVWKSHPTALLIASTNSLRPRPWIKDLQTTLKTSKPLALFRVAHGHERRPKGCAPPPEDLGYASVIGFADSYPLHILNLASVHALARHQHPHAPRLSALQFRANVYITGPTAYAEDEWKRVRIGGEEGEYHVACRTTRCKLPNVNQETGVVDEGVKGSGMSIVQGDETGALEGVRREAEPEAAMRKTRRIDRGARLQSCMGMMMVPAGQVGSMKVGDRIEVVATGEHFYVD